MVRNPAYGLPILAAACGAIMLPHSAFGQVAAKQRQADAAGYPCARSGQLTVVQSEGNFAIREKTEAPAPPARPAAIRLGTSLSLDSGLFARTSLVRPESANVPQQ